MAERLLRQREAQGDACFRNVRYAGSFLLITPELRWPERMPTKGTLELEFVSCVRVGTSVTPIQDELLHALWHRLEHETVSDAWRASLVRTLCAGSYFSCAQASSVLPNPLPQPET